MLRNLEVETPENSLIRPDVEGVVVVLVAQPPGGLASVIGICLQIERIQSSIKHAQPKPCDLLVTGPVY